MPHKESDLSLLRQVLADDETCSAIYGTFTWLAAVAPLALYADVSWDFAPHIASWTHLDVPEELYCRGESDAEYD